MPESGSPLVFISYRRADSSAASRWLAETVAKTFGAGSVFIDTEAIRIGEGWQERITEAIDRAAVVVPVIGPGWLRIADEDGRRRIDNEQDWVRNEIATALTRKVPVIPLLLSGAPLPKRHALPDSLQRLHQYQAFELRDDRWESDLSLLLARLEELGFQRVTAAAIRYPTPRVTLTELSQPELTEAFGQLTPDWKLLSSDLPSNAAIKRTELYRAFEFASFKDAISFMAAAVPDIVRLKHHPRWENVWRTISVWLSTWDIGHKPSRLDIELAQVLEQHRQHFPAPRSKKANL